MGSDMRIIPAIDNGLEFLNITSPNFKNSELNKTLTATKGSSFLIDSYAASVFLDRLSNRKLQGRIILTTFTLSYFTSTNVRSRFDDVVRVVKCLDKPDLMVYNEVLYRNPHIDKKKIEKIANTAVKMLEGIKEDIGRAVFVIPPEDDLDKLSVYFETIINAMGSKKIAFMISPNTTDTQINYILTKFPAPFISVR